MISLYFAARVMSEIIHNAGYYFVLKRMCKNKNEIKKALQCI